jgi:hypothetical protein
MVAPGVDIVGEVDDVLDGRGDLPRGRRRGQRVITRNAPPAADRASRAVARTPSDPWKARLEISSETVNPIPATAPPPTIVGRLSARRPNPNRVASVADTVMSTGLPATYAATIPRVIGDVSACPSTRRRRGRPRWQGRTAVRQESSSRDAAGAGGAVGRDRRRDTAPSAACQLGGRLVAEPARQRHPLSSRSRGRGYALVPGPIASPEMTGSMGDSYNAPRSPHSPQEALSAGTRGVGSRGLQRHLGAG